jgi:hypothetical protein
MIGFRSQTKQVALEWHAVSHGWKYVEFLSNKADSYRRLHIDHDLHDQNACFNSTLRGFGRSSTSHTNMSESKFGTIRKLEELPLTAGTIDLRLGRLFAAVRLIESRFKRYGQRYVPASKSLRSIPCKYTSSYPHILRRRAQKCRGNGPWIDLLSSYIL